MMFTDNAVVINMLGDVKLLVIKGWIQLFTFLRYSTFTVNAVVIKLVW